MKKVMLVFGTRPEAIKMCPLALEIKKSGTLKPVVCVTGQHREMLQQVLDIFHVEPEYNLKVMKPGQDLNDITSAVLLGMREIIKKEKPDAVLVHGDTTTAYASAVAAFYQQIPVGHVEAGLRTWNLYSPFPEEFNRQSISLLAQWHFAPTEVAKENLLREGKSPETIYVTGNTGIDAMRYTVSPHFTHPILSWAEGSRMLLITAHRRENLGSPMHAMFRSIRRIVEAFEDVKAVYPVHLNPLVQQAAREELSGCDRIRLIEPLDAVSFHNLMARSYLILTDSGGIQEEAPSLKKPVLVMRDTTERPEGVEAGTLCLVGTDEQVIYEKCHELLCDQKVYQSMCDAVNPYGDGKASIRIREAIENALKE